MPPHLIHISIDLRYQRLITFSPQCPWIVSGPANGESDRDENEAPELTINSRYTPYIIVNGRKISSSNGRLKNNKLQSTWRKHRAL